MRQQQMKVAAADFSPHACLTCTLRWDRSSFSAHSKWKREVHLLPGESRRHAAETLHFVFLGDSFCWQTHPPLCSQRPAVRQTRLLCFLLGTLDSSVQPRAPKPLQKRSPSSSDPRAWLTATVFHSLRSKQCFTSLQLSLVAWLPRVDLFYFTCTDTLCRFESAIKHPSSYLMGKPGTRVYSISLRWNSVVWALAPWPFSLLINGCQPTTSIYHPSPDQL